MQAELLYPLEKWFLHLQEYSDLCLFCLLNSEFEVRLPSIKRHRHPGESPAKGDGDDEGTGASLL